MCIETTSHYHPTKKRLGKKIMGGIIRLVDWVVFTKSAGYGAHQHFQVHLGAA